MSVGMARALMGDAIDRDAYVNREVLLAAVMRQIFCQKTGDLLDIRRAVLTTITREDGEHGPAINVAVIMTGEAFDANGGVRFARETAAKYHAAFEVIDGRDYEADGTLKVAARKRIEVERASAAQ